MIDTYPPRVSFEYPLAKVYCRCCHCDGHIYRGDTVYEIDGDTIHTECLDSYFEHCRIVIAEE